MSNKKPLYITESTVIENTEETTIENNDSIEKQYPELFYV